MRSSLLVLAILLSLLVAVACNSAKSKTNPVAQTQQQKNEPETIVADGARRITVEEARDLIKKNQAVVIDVRNQTSYDAGHIAGAKLIPAAEILNHVDELPKDKTIITYCS